MLQRALTVSGGGGGSTELKALIPFMTGSTSPSGKATASSEYSSGYAAINAFGMFIESYGWAPSSTGTQWLKYEFPEAKVVKACMTYSALAYTNRSILQGSNDNSTWTDLIKDGSAVNVDFTYHVCNWYSFDNTTAYKYYRWYFNPFSNDGGKGVACQLFGE